MKSVFFTTVSVQKLSAKRMRDSNAWQKVSKSSSDVTSLSVHFMDVIVAYGSEIVLAALLSIICCMNYSLILLLIDILI